METINVNALKAKYGRLERNNGKYCLSAFLAGANITKGTYSFISKMLRESEDENSKSPYLKYNEFSRDDIDNCISDFIDVINNIQDETDRQQELKYIDSLLDIIINDGQVDAATVDGKFNHDRIPRHIAAHFCTKVNADYWLERGTNEATVMSNLNGKTKVEWIEGQEVSKKLDPLYSDICQIIYWLQDDKGQRKSENKPAWTCAKRFIDAFRWCRNWADHINPNITNDNERCAAAAFILHTLTANFYCISQNLKGTIGETPHDSKILSVFYNGKVSEEIHRADQDATKDTIKPRLYQITADKVEIPANGDSIELQRLDFTIIKGEQYELLLGGEKANVDMERIWDSPSQNPVAIWNGVHPYFFSDLSNVPSQLSSYVDRANKEEIKKLRSAIEFASEMNKENADATKTLTKALDNLSDAFEKNNKWFKVLVAVRIAMLAFVAVGVIIYALNTYLSKKESIQVELVEPYEQEYNAYIVNSWAGMNDFDSFINDSLPDPASMVYQFDSLSNLKELILQKGQRIMKYQYMDQQIVSQYKEKDSVSLADIDGWDEHGLPNAGHLEIGESAEAISYMASPFKMNYEKTDIEYAKFRIDVTDVNNDLYKRERVLPPENLEKKGRDVTVTFKYSSDSIVGGLKKVMFCPYLFNRILPGGMGYSFCTRIGQLAVHIPKEIHFDILEDHQTVKSFILHVNQQVNPSGDVTGLEYTMEIKHDYGYQPVPLRINYTLKHKRTKVDSK